MTDKITLDELRRMFGGTIPKAAMEIVRGANDNATLDDIRRDLEALAASAYDAPSKRNFRVMFGKELNCGQADGQE